MDGDMTVEEMLRQCAHAMSGTFTRQDVFAWFRRHYPGAHERTVGTLMNAMTSNSINREKHHPHHGAKEPLFDRVGHGLYRVHQPGSQEPATTGPRPSSTPRAMPLVEAPATTATSHAPLVPGATADRASVRHVSFQENDEGVSYDGLFAEYLVGATEITVVDPYIRMFHQARNLMEFLETIARCKAPGERVTLRLVTIEDTDPSRALKQMEFLTQIRDAATAVGVALTVTFDPTVHDREIRTNTGWRILLGRGLDIYQYVPNDTFSMSTRLQELRRVKSFSVTYLREPTRM